MDGSGIYVTDSSANRVLAFSLERAKPKVLSAHQDKAYDLAIDESNVYFDLALKGDLLRIPKAGGAAKKLAGGLADRARIAADKNGVFATLAATDDKGPQTLVRIPNDGGKPIAMATVPYGHTVEAITLDDKCVYWADREAGSSNTVVFARAR